MVWHEHKLKLDELELCLVPYIGGRLMDVRYKGASLLFQNPDLLDRLPDLNRLSELPSRASHLSFPLWGGEKTWLAPDSEWPKGAPHPVLDSGPFEVETHQANAVTMVSAICPDSGMQISRTISLKDHRNWTIRHQVTNKGKIEKRVGLWSVMMTRAPASYLFRLADDVTPSVVFGDPKDAFSNVDGIGQVSCNAQHEFKLGVNPNTGCSAARILTEQGAIWIVNTGSIESNFDNYAHGHALEFYNSEHYEYGELEWHSPAVSLAPGKSLEFTLGYHLFIEPVKSSVHEMFKSIEKQCQREQ